MCGAGRGPWNGVSRDRWDDWEWQIGHRIRSLDGLASALGQPASSLAACGPVTRLYPLAVTPYYLSLAHGAGPDDPLRRQCFPDLRELDPSPGESDDPLGEEQAMPVPGLIHRYPDRCLFVVTGACAVYCRHCNRKRIWCRESPRGPGQGLQPMIDYVARTPSLREVIISGGDPLLLPDGLLDGLLGALRAIPHVEVLRIGSRAPVTLPMRVTAALCAVLKRHRPLWFNTQFNHVREITPESSRACEQLLMAGIPVSNQSVLLRGVNDDVGTMRDLLIGLERISVRPYYLFHCDPVRGTGHFRVGVGEGVTIMEQLRRGISGLCLPRYVLDLPGDGGKVPLGHVMGSARGEAGNEQHSFDKRDRMD
ncbi:MAG: KamA family radical SAM protein [Thermodesulfobacteriota bacterium]